MTQTTPQRLVKIRADNMKWSALQDTASWESTFFLNLVDSLLAEIKELRKGARR